MGYTASFRVDWGQKVDLPFFATSGPSLSKTEHVCVRALDKRIFTASRGFCKGFTPVLYW